MQQTAKAHNGILDRLWAAAFLFAGMDAALMFKGPGGLNLSAFRITLVLALLGSLARSLATGAIVIPANPSLVPYSCWILWSAASVTWATDLHSSLRYVGLLGLLSVLVIVPAMASSGRYFKLLRASLYCIIAALVCGAIEMITHWRVPASRILPFLNEVTAFFLNPIHFALSIALFTPLLVFWTARRATLGRAVMTAVLLIATTILIVRAGSRTALIVHSLSLVLLLVGMRAVGREPRRAVRISVIAALLASALVWRFGAGTPAIVIEKLTTAPELLAGRFEAFGAWERAEIMGKAFSLWLSAPVAGYGVGSAEELVGLAAGLDIPYSLHCWALELLVNTGIVGFSLFALFIAGILRQLVAGYFAAAGPEERLGTWCFIVSMLASLPATFGPGSMLTLPTYWVFLGVAVGWGSSIARRQRESGHGSSLN